MIARSGFSDKPWIHGGDLVLLALQRRLQILECALYLDGMKGALCLTAELLDDASVIAGMNLLCSRRCPKQARRTVPALLVGLGRKGVVPGMCIRLAFEGGEKILERLGISNSDRSHSILPLPAA